ncbi:alpha/beta hydrolase [Leptospira idonii]|uniref:Alpha/beta hydrolase n=1 Tax=Leptospira idonii TaxID=1193500 RepID=A0A4R9M3T0_9LEPT|nr:alpha/beta hydrolase [Leptospira idonii]TGN20631.1 alpha/beta hydrolase [Leptospira idonii]
MTQKQERNRQPKRNRILLRLGYFSVIILALILFSFAVGIWSASNQILFPVWKGISKNFKECSQEGEKVWGKSCGNIRITKQFHFHEVSFLSLNGYDLSCHGEAPCMVPGLSFGNRESRDVLSAYLYLFNKYKNILIVGSSVGASSVLIALPFLRDAKGLILENPMFSFERLILDSPESASLPNWAVQSLIGLVTTRGKFDLLLSPENSLRLSSSVPLFFIHSKKDSVVSYQHSESLSKLYPGMSEVWFPDSGSHGFIWDENRTEYEIRVRNFIRKNIK